MGRKNTVPYGLYRAHGFVSPMLAAQHPNRKAQGSGFSDDDCALLWTALEQMFEHDRSASRGLMATRALVVFEHGSALGSAPAHSLFDRLKIEACATPPRSYSDYAVTLDGAPLQGLRTLVKVGDGDASAA